VSSCAPRYSTSVGLLSTAPRDLTVSVVVYNPDVAILAKTLASLASSVRDACQAGVIRGAEVDLVDNGSAPSDIERALETARIADGEEGLRARIVRGHGNVGYGRGHNLSIRPARSDYHLVLNPDVVVATDAVRNAVAYLSTNERVVMVAPDARNENGEQQYLAKAYPSVLVLFLRSFAPMWMRRRYRTLMDRYELRDAIDAGEPVTVPLASGCFMFSRTASLQTIGGFSPAYFLYFEDHDLSRRLRELGDIVYLPDVRIVHYGGNASRKGWKHLRMYVASAFTFFQRHGWRIA